MPANQTEAQTTTASGAGSPRSRAWHNGAPGRFWHKSAPERVRRASRAANDQQAWTGWKRHLAGRREPLPLASLLPGTDSPLVWAVPESMSIRLAAQLPFITGKSARKSSEGKLAEQVEREVLDWLSHAGGSPPSAEYGLESLAWCHAMPELAQSVTGGTWWSLLEHLVVSAADAESLPLESAPPTHQLLAGELPLALAYLFPEITPCRKLASPARVALSAGLIDLLDGEGLPHATRLDVFRPLMACWTRCRAIGERLSKGCWNREAELQYRWVVRSALHLMRHDGNQVFSDATDSWQKALFEAALQLGGDEDDREIAALVLPNGKGGKRKRGSLLSLPEPAMHSEWSAVSVLRPGWSRKQPRLVAAYPGRAVNVELGCGSDLIWSGSWELDIRCDGQSLQPQSDWEEICWYTDDDVHYLELEISLGETVRVQRHMLMAREDRFLLIADAVLSRRPAKLDYRSTLPLADGIRFQSADETREGLLVGNKPRALILPLAFPEWRCDPRGGVLAVDEGRLEFSQSCEGRAMFAPLFLDLDPRRIRRAFTWRRLTVAENRQPLSDDAAVGYRVQVGKDQWLIYRTLSEPGNRTLLGHNLVSQMLIARFDTDGEVSSLVEIE